MEQQEAYDGASVEEQIEEFLENRGPEGVSTEELQDALFLEYDSFRSAILRLREKRRVFQFSVDDIFYFVAWKHRRSAHVVQPLSVDTQIKEIYRAFGSDFPETIKRTPMYTPVRKSGGKGYSDRFGPDDEGDDQLDDGADEDEQ